MMYPDANRAGVCECVCVREGQGDGYDVLAGRPPDAGEID